MRSDAAKAEAELKAAELKRWSDVASAESRADAPESKLSESRAASKALTATNQRLNDSLRASQLKTSELELRLRALEAIAVCTRS